MGFQTCGMTGSLRLLVPPLFLLLLLGASGCATVAPLPSPGPGAVAADNARQLIGIPYRYGGTNRSGLDCSGLVQLAWREAGVELPRSSRAQYSAVSPVSPDALHPGDLLFFRIGTKVSHVALYVGDGQFIHAPSSGKRVGVGRLDQPYWRQRLVRAGRVPTGR